MTAAPRMLEVALSTVTVSPGSAPGPFYATTTISGAFSIILQWSQEPHLWALAQAEALRTITSAYPGRAGRITFAVCFILSELLIC